MNLTITMYIINFYFSRTHIKSAPDDIESENASPHNIKDQSCLQRLTVPFANLHISVNRSHLTHDDIDHRNRHKMFECSEYAFGIFEYMRMRQDVFTISSNFIEIVQKEITTDMRAVVVNWMVQVGRVNDSNALFAMFSVS